MTSVVTGLACVGAFVSVLAASAARVDEWTIATAGRPMPTTRGLCVLFEGESELHPVAALLSCRRAPLVPQRLHRVRPRPNEHTRRLAVVEVFPVAPGAGCGDFSAPPGAGSSEWDFVSERSEAKSPQREDAIGVVTFAIIGARRGNVART